MDILDWLAGMPIKDWQLGADPTEVQHQTLRAWACNTLWVKTQGCVLTHNGTTPFEWSLTFQHPLLRSSIRHVLRFNADGTLRDHKRVTTRPSPNQ